MEAHFVRGPCFPRKTFLDATLVSLSPRGQYLHDRTMERYVKTENGKEWIALGRNVALQGETGHTENFRFITDLPVDPERKSYFPLSGHHETYHNCHHER